MAWSIGQIHCDEVLVRQSSTDGWLGSVLVARKPVFRPVPRKVGLVQFRKAPKPRTEL